MAEEAPDSGSAGNGGLRSRRRSSCCSPTAPTPAASHPRRPRNWLLRKGFGSIPIGFGTTNPTTLVCTADQLGGDRFDRFRGGGPGRGASARRNFLVADEGTLREVAETTGGEYFAASDARGLQQVLTDLPRQVQVQQRDVEVSVALVGLAVLLLLGAAWAAVRWTAFPT